MSQEKENNTTAALDRAFEWRTAFNELKSIQPLIKAIELECSETTMNLETLLAALLSRLSVAKQQRIKDFAYGFGDVQSEGMSRDKFVEIKQEIEFRSKSAQELYTIVSREIHDPLLKFKWMLVSAEKGCAEAQAFVGWCYCEPSYGRSENKMQSLYWYTKAAKQNHVEAQYVLDTFFTEKSFVPKSIEEAEIRFSDALENYTKIQNDAKEKAQLEFTLGNCYYQGYGVPVDIKQAIHFYSLAADKDHCDAQSKLSVLYFRSGNPEHKSLTFKLLRNLAEKGDADSQERLAYLLDQNKESQVEATKWRMLACEQNDHQALYNMACDYKSRGDIKNAYELFLRSAKLGNLSACHSLGRHVIVAQKENVWTNFCSPKEQLEWLTWSAERGYSDSQVNLGIYLEKQNEFSKALDCYVKASNRGNKYGYNCLAIFYDKGVCVKKNPLLAIELFTLAANLGAAVAQFSLGLRYYGVIRYEFILDKEKGLMWIRKASELGNKHAKEWLNDLDK